MSSSFNANNVVFILLIVIMSRIDKLDQKIWAMPDHFVSKFGSLLTICRYKVLFKESAPVNGNVLLRSFINMHMDTF